VANRAEVKSEFDTTPTLEELATRQGVRPVEDLESILGPRRNGDEDSVDDFLLLLREWRREGE